MKSVKNIFLLVLALVIMTALPAMATTQRLGAKLPIPFNAEKTLAKTAAYTVTASDCGSLISVTATSATIAITMPLISTLTGDCPVKILKADATAYAIIVTPATGDAVGGESTRYLTNQNAYMVIHAGPASKNWTVDFESPLIDENYETGAINFNGISSSQFTSDTTLGGTTPVLTIGDAGAEDAAIVFDGNAQDFYIGLDDSADDLVIGLGSALGTTLALSIDESQVTTWTGGTIKLAAVTTGTDVLTVAECGKTIFLNSATEYQTTLPALSTAPAGCEFTFIVKAAASAANYTIITGNTTENKIYGSMEVAGAIVPCADEDTITLVDGNAVGDWVRVISDGTNWYLFGTTVTSAKATCTQAS